MRRGAEAILVLNRPIKDLFLTPKQLRHVHSSFDFQFTSELQTQEEFSSKKKTLLSFISLKRVGLQYVILLHLYLEEITEIL